MEKDRNKRRKKTKPIKRQMSGTRIMGFGFLTLITLGTILLMLPVSNADGNALNFIDALFTATSASCVTGLVTIVPATQFSVFGKVVLFVLIQVGGLGIIMCSALLLIIFTRRMNLVQRNLIQQNFDISGTRGMYSLAKRVLGGTFLVEGIGALLYMPEFIPVYGTGKGILLSVFHAVSAFCNAGIDLLGDSSLERYADNVYMNLVTALLIIVSGIGYLVWDDTVAAIKKVLTKKTGMRKALHDMTFHSKLVYATTTILIFGGMAGIYLLEFSNPDTIGGLSFGKGLVAAFFQSVTTRTAGFAAVSQGALREGTKFLCCLMMFIGGSPGGTAGGMKTTTVAVIFLTCYAVIAGKDDTEAYGRRISEHNVRSALAVLTLGAVFLFTGTILLCAVEPYGLSDILYEVTSAVATVGLTTGITSSLQATSKLVIIVLMYIGRIGPMTLTQFLRTSSLKSQNLRKLPERKVYIG